MEEPERFLSLAPRAEPTRVPALWIGKSYLTTEGNWDYILEPAVAERLLEKIKVADIVEL